MKNLELGKLHFNYLHALKYLCICYVTIGERIWIPVSISFYWIQYLSPYLASDIKNRHYYLSLFYVAGHIFLCKPKCQQKSLWLMTRYSRLGKSLISRYYFITYHWAKSWSSSVTTSRVSEVHKCGIFEIKIVQDDFSESCCTSIATIGTGFNSSSRCW